MYVTVIYYINFCNTDILIHILILHMAAMYICTSFNI